MTLSFVALLELYCVLKASIHSVTWKFDKPIYMATETLTEETNISEWTCEQTAQWASKHFNEEVAKCFKGTYIYIFSLHAFLLTSNSYSTVLTT